ncbi:MAG: hypothetical protein A2021_06390 [Elusimicrobia bacterium GWF2_52_66]|nr:MAG: hypothetical protein A2021_06390 [Elusimicrobia bacterium GWF2_52_66]HAF95239.1 hypothetical protein [Elusimicrobiota bacterium]HCE97318.1 hypothetical protein [Elusimicrobiota bacterium]
MSHRKLFIKKVVLVPGYQCNNRCVFCINTDKRTLKIRGTFEIKREIVAASKRGCNYLEFAGGENTIRPDFCELVRCGRDCGFKRIAVATNGRMFSYPAFAREAIDSGLTDIIFSIHGHNAHVHDGLTQVKGSFAQLMRGFENVRKRFKGILATNTAITRLNFRSLPEIGEFIAGFGFYNSEFIYADPNAGGVKNNFKKLMPRISQCAPYIRACLDIAGAIAKKGGPRDFTYNWAARYVPLCYFREYYPRQISEAREAEIYQNVQHVAPDYVNMDYMKGRREVSRRKPPRCRGCALYAQCEGIWEEYLRVYGDGELVKLK